MQLISKVHLNKRQRRVVKRICAIQIENLNQLLNEDRIDTLIYQSNNVEDGCLLTQLELVARDFERVYNEPEKFPNLDEDCISIFRHILYNFIPDEKYPRTKKELFKKLFTLERINQNYNLN